MSIDRTTLFKGPGHIIFDGTAFLAADDIQVKLSDEFEEVNSNGYGVIDRRRKNRRVEITCTPLEWNNLALLYAYASTQIGESIFGATDKILQIVPRNGANSGLTFANAAVTKMPLARFSASKGPLGSMTFTAIIANNSDPALDASYWSVSDVGALPIPDLSKIRNGIYTAHWGAGGGALLNLGGAEGIELDTELAINWTDIDGHGSVDANLGGLVASVKLTPVNLALSALLTAMGGAIGASLTKKDLVIKNGATTVITVPNCQLISSEANYGNQQRRVGPIEFRSVRSAAVGGDLAPLWTIA